MDASYDECNDLLEERSMFKLLGGMSDVVQVSTVTRQYTMPYKLHISMMSFNKVKKVLVGG